MRSLSFRAWVIACLLLFPGVVGSEPVTRTLFTVPEKATVYLEDPQGSPAPSNLPIPEGYSLPPGRVIGLSGAPVLLDFPPDGKLHLFLLHPDCEPAPVLLGSSTPMNESFILKPRTYELTVHTQPPGATLFLVVPYGELPASEVKRLAPKDFAWQPGKVLGLSGEPLLVPAGGRPTCILLHPHCLPVERELHTLQGQTIPLPYRNAFYWAQAHTWWFGPPLLALSCAGWWLWRRTRRQVREAEALDQRARRVTELVAPDAGDDPYVGKRLDRYRVLQRLGEGGMAKVYLAVPDETLDEKEAVALKILNADALADAELRARFDRERRVYEGLHHPNIVKVFASGLFQNQMYLAMEVVRGRTLRAYVFEDGMPFKKVMELLTPVFEAVQFANRKGIVHRDLKPENIMMTESGQIKVMDFGLARASNFSRVTATGSVLGTPGYMAPEQIEGRLEVQTDQYALGIMVYEMLTGRLPFYDENPVTIIISHLTKEVPPLAAGRPQLSKVQPVVERMLAKHPGDRYRDLEHALTALRYVL